MSVEPSQQVVAVDALGDHAPMAIVTDTVRPIRAGELFVGQLLVNLLSRATLLCSSV